MKTNERRLTIDIPTDHHADIKIRAAERFMSMKDWVLQAIIEKMSRENQYE